MKLTEHTLKFLKNFASINPSILFRPGSVIATQSIAGDILADAQIEEEIPCEFCLYDLQEFLNTLKLFSSPVLDFRNADDNFLYICEEDDLNFKVRYTFTKKDRIVYPKRKVVIDNEDIIFDMSTDNLESAIKAANVMQLPYLIITPSKRDGMIDISVTDIKDKSSNKFSISVNAEFCDDSKFKIIFKMEAFKMLLYDYRVTISGNSHSMFESDNINYYLGVDINSKF